VVIRFPDIGEIVAHFCLSFLYISCKSLLTIVNKNQE